MSQLIVPTSKTYPFILGSAVAVSEDDTLQVNFDVANWTIIKIIGQPVISGTPGDNITSFILPVGGSITYIFGTASSIQSATPQTRYSATDIPMGYIPIQDCLQNDHNAYFDLVLYRANETANAWVIAGTVVGQRGAVNAAMSNMVSGKFQLSSALTGLIIDTGSVDGWCDGSSIYAYGLAKEDE